MRVLCVSAQLPGHLDWGGYAATVALLQQRGHELLWASGREVSGLLQARGLPTHTLTETGWRWPPPPPFRPAPGDSREAILIHRQRRSLDQWLDVDRVETATAELVIVAQQFRPDLILSEMFMAGAALVAEMVDAPFAVVGWPAPPRNASTSDQPTTVEARQRLDTLLDRFDLRGSNWTENGLPALCSPHGHVTFWSDRWFGTKPVTPTEHVGGKAAAAQSAPPADLPPPALDPWALITLGTSFNDDPAFFVASASAADRIGAVPLVVHGRRPGDERVGQFQAQLPASARLFPMLDLHATLPHVAVAIHHGGAGTTHALVTHAIPQIVVPHAADQQRQARGVARTGVGFHMAPRQASVENLERALAALLPDRSDYHQNAHVLRDEFAALGGVERAADLLERLAS